MCSFFSLSIAVRRWSVLQDYMVHICIWGTMLYNAQVSTELPCKWKAQMFADAMQIQAKCCTKEVSTELVKRVTKNWFTLWCPTLPVFTLNWKNFQQAIWLHTTTTYIRTYHIVSYIYVRMVVDCDALLVVNIAFHIFNAGTNFTGHVSVVNTSTTVCQVWRNYPVIIATHHIMMLLQGTNERWHHHSLTLGFSVTIPHPTLYELCSFME